MTTGSTNRGAGWRPTHQDPLFLLAMDHRASFGATLFSVHDDRPTDQQAESMEQAKDLIYSGLRAARAGVTSGRPGVLVDPRYGRAVIERARPDGVVLAVPIEASGHDWFTLEEGEHWLASVEDLEPDYAKVLVRDNPSFAADDRQRQSDHLAAVSAALHEHAVAWIFELLVPATDEQSSGVGGDLERYDRDVRPELVVQVIADQQRAGVEPALWKVEGLDTAEAAHSVADQARAGGRDADLIVLGRDAPAERLDRWLDIAAGVEAFVGFAIGRSIWADTIRGWVAGQVDDDAAIRQIADDYLGFVTRWSSAGR